MLNKPSPSSEQTKRGTTTNGRGRRATRRPYQANMSPKKFSTSSYSAPMTSHWWRHDRCDPSYCHCIYTDNVTVFSWSVLSTYAVVLLGEGEGRRCRNPCNHWSKLKYSTSLYACTASVNVLPTRACNAFTSCGYVRRCISSSDGSLQSFGVRYRGELAWPL